MNRLLKETVLRGDLLTCWICSYIFS